MEYVYAALMLHKLKKEITEENVTSIVKASGAEVNEAKVKSLVASLADVNIEDGQERREEGQSSRRQERRSSNGRTFILIWLILYHQF